MLRPEQETAEVSPLRPAAPRQDERPSINEAPQCAVRPAATGGKRDGEKRIRKEGGGGANRTVADGLAEKVALRKISW